MHKFVLIPAYNEEKTIRKVVEDSKHYVDEVIVVDDGSLDQTSSEAKRGGALVLGHIINRGQGAALQTGFDFIKNKIAEEGLLPESDKKYVVITFDADGQFEPSEIPKFLEPINNKEVDVVLGSRFLGAALNIPKFKKMLLGLAVLLTNLLTGLKLTDTHNGFRALSAKAVDLIQITQNRMAHGSEILEKIAKYHLSYLEIPVTVKYSDYSMSKGQKINDYFKILFDLFLRKLVQ